MLRGADRLPHILRIALATLSVEDLESQASVRLPCTHHGAFGAWPANGNLHSVFSADSVACSVKLAVEVARRF